MAISKSSRLQGCLVRGSESGTSYIRQSIQKSASSSSSRTLPLGSAQLHSPNWSSWRMEKQPAWASFLPDHVQTCPRTQPAMKTVTGKNLRARVLTLQPSRRVHMHEHADIRFEPPSGLFQLSELGNSNPSSWPHEDFCLHHHTQGRKYLDARSGRSPRAWLWLTKPTAARSQTPVITRSSRR